MSNSDHARIGALYPLMVALGLLLGAAAHTFSWGLVVFMVLCQVVLAIWLLARDDSDVTEER